jgi:Cof subfamily protein (haloacid dehalogenase superfamily)
MTEPARPIRLVVTDVDGTLIKHDHSLAPSTIAAVGKLRAAGVKLALVSSRPARGLDVLLEPLGIDTPRAGFNGGEILGPNHELLREHTIAPETCRRVVAAMEAAGVAAWVFDAGKWLLKDPNAAYVQREFRSISQDWQVVSDFSPYFGRVHKIMGASEDFPLMGRLEAELQAAVAGSATVLRSQNYYLDVTNPDANKGKAALGLAELLGVDPLEMACIGDMPNDTPMFAVAGFSVAMGNAPDAVKRLASAVTADNDSDGWAMAIERHVLTRAAG